MISRILIVAWIHGFTLMATLSELALALRLKK